MVYLPTLSLFLMANVGKYTIHGSYGKVILYFLPSRKSQSFTTIFGRPSKKQIRGKTLHSTWLNNHWIILSKTIRKKKPLYPLKQILSHTMGRLYIYQKITYKFMVEFFAGFHVGKKTRKCRGMRVEFLQSQVVLSSKLHQAR